MVKKINPLFFNVFQSFPNLSVLIINSMDDFILDELIERVSTLYGSVDIKESSKEFLTSIEEKYSNINRVDINCSIFEPNRRFRASSREYEYAIIADSLSLVDDKKLFLKSIYQSLENSAELILVSNREKIELQTIINILDDIGFLAINELDICNENFVIVAKKMHMWGNGL